MGKPKSQEKVAGKAAPTATVQKQPETPEQHRGATPASHTPTSALPPPNGRPPAARAADLMTSSAPGVGAIRRAQMATGIQQTVGNARISRMVGGTVQTKLTVGAPDDVYEQEADRVADTVMRMPEPRTVGAIPVSTTAQPGPVQRLCPECEKTRQKGQGTHQTLQTSPAKLQASTLWRCPNCGRVMRQLSEDAPAEPHILPANEPTGQTPAVTPETESYLKTSKGGGQSLPTSVRAFMEPRFAQDFSNVQVHSDSKAAGAAKDLSAQAFTHGQDIYFGNGRYQPDTAQGQQLLAHELTHVVQQAQPQAQEGAATGGAPSDREKGPVNFLSTQGHGVSPANTIQPKEFGPTDDPKTMQDGDWTYMDRLTRTERWDKANSYNLENGRSHQYTQIDQRRDFYLWFYEKMRSRGHELKWPLAAYVVAGGANEVANRDPVGWNVMRGNTLEQLMRRGNQVIFDDVFPKLRLLIFRREPLRGAEAEAWDMQTLIEEQNLIQPLYQSLSPDDVKTMENLAKQKGFITTIGSAIIGDVDAGPYHSGGSVPPFPDDYELSNPVHRYRYGMMLAHFFTSGAIMANWPASRAWAEALPVPEAPEQYKNGDMLKRYDRFPNLHQLSSVISDAASTVDEIKNEVYKLTDEERQIATTDSWFTATLRHKRQMSMIEAKAILNSEDISQCGPLFQVIGGIEGTGFAKEEDNIIVWLREGASWSTSSGQERVQVQAVSEPAYKLFTGVPLRWVWKSSLHCYPKKRPVPPPPPPFERLFTVYFDTQSDVIMNDKNEWSNREVLNDVLAMLKEYGEYTTVSDIRMSIVGNASARWNSAKTFADAATENEKLANRRAQNVRTYIMDVYQQYKGPVPMIVINPLTKAVLIPVPDNTTPAKVVTDEGKGSEESLGQTADPRNNDQRYRRVDITIRVLFEKTASP